MNHSELSLHIPYLRPEKRRKLRGIVGGGCLILALTCGTAAFFLNEAVQDADTSAQITDLEGDNAVLWAKLSKLDARVTNAQDPTPKGHEEAQKLWNRADASIETQERYRKEVISLHDYSDSLARWRLGALLVTITGVAGLAASQGLLRDDGLFDNGLLRQNKGTLYLSDLLGEEPN